MPQLRSSRTEFRVKGLGVKWGLGFSKDFMEVLKSGSKALGLVLKATTTDPSLGLTSSKACIQKPHLKCYYLEDRMTLESWGPIELYYESLYGL